MRADFTFEIPPGLIASSISLHRSMRHRAPRREALAQAHERHVAVAVVGGLREDRQDQLAERVAVRLHARRSINGAQPLPDAAHSISARARSMPWSQGIVARGL